MSANSKKEIENSDSKNGRPLRDQDLDAVAGGLGGQSDNVVDDTEGGHTTYKPV